MVQMIFSDGLPQVFKTTWKMYMQQHNKGKYNNQQRGERFVHPFVGYINS